MNKSIIVVVMHCIGVPIPIRFGSNPRVVIDVLY